MKKVDNVVYRFDGSQWRRASVAICRECGLEFLALVRHLKNGHGKFCSRQCQRANQAKINAEANRTVGLSAAERKRKWVASVSPQVVYAHKQVQYAIANGTLVREPCSVCGDIKVDAHHDDYGKPLDVRWLCRAHHLEHHRGGKNWHLRCR